MFASMKNGGALSHAAHRLGSLPLPWTPAKLRRAQQARFNVWRHFARKNSMRGYGSPANRKNNTKPILWSQP